MSDPIVDKIVATAIATDHQPDILIILRDVTEAAKAYREQQAMPDPGNVWRDTAIERAETYTATITAALGMTDRPIFRAEQVEECPLTPGLTHSYVWNTDGTWTCNQCRKHLR